MTCLESINHKQKRKTKNSAKTKKKHENNIKYNKIGCLYG